MNKTDNFCLLNMKKKNEFIKKKKKAVGKSCILL